MYIEDLNESYCTCHVEVMESICEALRLERDGCDILAENVAVDALFKINKTCGDLADFIQKRMTKMTTRISDKNLDTIINKIDKALSKNDDTASELEESDLQLKIWKCDLDWNRAISNFKDDMGSSKMKPRRAKKRFAETLLKTTNIGIHDMPSIETILVTYEHSSVKITSANLRAASMSVIAGYRETISITKSVVAELHKIRKETKKGKESIALGLKKLNYMMYCINLVNKTIDAMFLAETYFLTTLRSVVRVIKKGAKSGTVDVEDLQDVIDGQLTYIKIKDTERMIQAYSAGVAASRG